jgi:hypothetical protein
MCQKHYNAWYHDEGRNAPSLVRYGRSCSIDGCESAHKANGLCSRHYARMRRRGNTDVDHHASASVGAKRLGPDGYIEVKTEDGQKHWPLAHRVVMERLLGRRLATFEHVHHINGVKDDNRPENLEVMGNAEHQLIHEHWLLRAKPPVTLVCERCGTTYTRKPSRAAESRYCGNDCKMQVMVEAASEARRRKAAERRARKER